MDSVSLYEILDKCPSESTATVYLSLSIGREGFVVLVAVPMPFRSHLIRQAMAGVDELLYGVVAVDET